MDLNNPSNDTVIRCTCSIATTVKNTIDVTIRHPIFNGETDFHLVLDENGPFRGVHTSNGRRTRKLIMSAKIKREKKKKKDKGQKKKK